MIVQVLSDSEGVYGVWALSGSPSLLLFTSCLRAWNKGWVWEFSLIYVWEVPHDLRARAESTTHHAILLRNLQEILSGIKSLIHWFIFLVEHTLHSFSFLRLGFYCLFVPSLRKRRAIFSDLWCIEVILFRLDVESSKLHFLPGSVVYLIPSRGLLATLRLLTALVYGLSDLSCLLSTGQRTQSWTLVHSATDHLLVLPLSWFKNSTREQ